MYIERIEFIKCIYGLYFEITKFRKRNIHTIKYMFTYTLSFLLYFYCGQVRDGWLCKIDILCGISLYIAGHISRISVSLTYRTRGKILYFSELNSIFIYIHTNILCFIQINIQLMSYKTDIMALDNFHPTICWLYIYITIKKH